MILDWLMPWRKNNAVVEREIDLREQKVEEHTERMQNQREKNGFGLMFGNAGLGSIDPRNGRS